MKHSPPEKIWPYFIYYLTQEDILPYKALRRFLEKGLCSLPVAAESFVLITEEKISEYRHLKDLMYQVLQERWQALITAAEDLRRSSEKQGIFALALGDPLYPPLLAAVPDAPLALFYQGNISAYRNYRAHLAIVGSRKMTPYAARFLEQEVSKIIPYKVTVTSGLARGCDTAAHLSCLRNGGFTTACLAHGIDLIYPAEHKKIKEEIARTGLILSEYPLGTKPRPYYFPARNRIISGLSHACFVAEAALSSGSLITADLAAEQGREVAVLCASVFRESSAGSNALLRDGARAILNYQDLLDLLNIKRENTPYEAAFAENLPPVLKAISEEALSETELSLKLNMPLKELRIALLKYEAAGRVRRFRGRFFLTRA